MESARRWRTPSLITRRSTTASILCAALFESFGRVGEPNSTVSPSIRRRTNPSRRAFSMTSRNSPASLWTNGASRIIFVPSGQVRTSSVICCGVWRTTGSQWRDHAVCQSPQKADGDNRKSRWLSRWSTADWQPNCAARWQSPEKALDIIDIRLLHLVQETAGHRQKDSRRICAAPRRKACRKRGTTCRSRSGPSKRPACSAESRHRYSAGCAVSPL